MVFENTISLKELLTCGIAFHHMLLILSQLIVSRIMLINSGVVNMSITTINVILPAALETEVLVINSFLSVLTERSQGRGHRGGSLRLIL